MASLIIDDVMAKPMALVALLGLHTKANEGEHLYGINIDRGYRVATPCGNRHVDIQGIEVGDAVELKLTWVERTSPEHHYTDETFPSFDSVQNLAGEVVAFVSNAEWPRYNRKVFKAPRRVTKIFDDKPYKSVEVVCLISSSMETMALYQEFTGEDRNWSFKQDMGSHQHTIAWIEDKPVAITPWVHVVNGVTVMYVEAQSALIDWDVIEVWIKERVREGTPIVIDPTNLISAISQISRSKES
jgi:hypothetical protein